MNQERIEEKLSSKWESMDERCGAGSKGGHIVAGIFLLVIGGLWLASEAGVFALPGWVFTWPMILITIGLFIGIRHGFRKGPWFFFLLIGGIFLYDRMSSEVSLRPYLWPILIITVGLFFIFKPRKWRRKHGYVADTLPGTASVPGSNIADEHHPVNERNDVIDITAIFGGVKKNMLSKNFKGGDIVAFMGGTEINLTQADFSGRVSIDCFNMFGGTKLIVPPDWNVQSEVVTIFGGVDDKRQPSPHTDPGKVLFLEGTCIFGGIEIRSF